MRRNSTQTDTYILQLLHKELTPAVGCTEPAAVALTCAKGKLYIEDRVKILTVYVSRNIYKNGLCVGIPGTTTKGLMIAATLGFVCGNADANLEVLQNVTDQAVIEAKSLIQDGIVAIKLDESHNDIYVKTVIVDKRDNTIEVVLAGDHTHIVKVTKNGKVVMKAPVVLSSEDYLLDKTVSIDAIYTFALNCDLKDIDFLQKYACMNYQAAECGISQSYGMSIGRHFYEKSFVNGYSVKSDTEVPSDIINPLTGQMILEVASFTAGASDARMSGCDNPIMTNSGSGNQGITTSVPIYYIGAKTGASKEKIIRALCVSNLIAIYLKQHSDRLSAFCGVVTAAIGAACGIAYMYDANLTVLEDIINVSFSGISGMICDGAKSSCAFKIFLAIQNALFATKLTFAKGYVPHGEGIICNSAEETIQNIHTLTMEGMRETDLAILSMMKEF